MNANGNNLRDETGALIGGLDVLEYNAGFEDFNAGNPPPDMTSPSYDLGRQLGARRKAEKLAFDVWMKADEERRDRVMREVLPPDIYAEYAERIAAIRSGKKP